MSASSSSARRSLLFGVVTLGSVAALVAPALTAGCGEHGELIARRRGDAGTLAGCVASTGAPVTLTTSSSGYIIDNGLVWMRLANNGILAQLRRADRELGTSVNQAMYVSEGAEKASYYLMDATSHAVVRQSEDLVEVAFHDDRSVPNHDMDWELHYVVQRGLSGYHYFLIGRVGTANHPEPFTAGELRTVMKLDPAIFDHGYNGERHGELPTPEQNAAFSGEPPFALVEPTVLPGSSSKPEIVGQYFDSGPLYSRYDWATYRASDRLHGLFGHGLGVWLVSPSFEFYTGGPLKQDLTVYQQNVLVNMYHADHFGANIDAPSQSPPSWEKLYGPNFVYVNAGTDGSMRNDAERQAAREAEAWPPCWMQHELFPAASQRGRVHGRIVERHDRSVDRAMIVLAGPGPLLPQAYGYMYWTQADVEGRFEIANVRPGRYSIHVFATQGLIVDDPTHGEIVGQVTVTAGDDDVGTWTWEPPYHPTLLWSIGRSDRKSGEFRLTPDLPPGEPNLANQTGRLSGLSSTQLTWQIPPVDHTFRVGRDTPSRDWYFAQSSNGTWNVEFGLGSVPSAGAHLTLALAGTSGAPSLHVTINGFEVAVLDLSDDHAMTLSALQGGRYQLVTLTLPPERLQIGDNILSLVLDTHGNVGAGVYYDVLTLEAD